jgi:integrase
VPLALQAQAIVAQNNNPEAIYVFSTNADHATHVQSYSKIKKQLDELSGVTGWSFHDIRRTVATRLAAQGLSVELVRLILNHTDNSVTAIYNRHSYMNERREALQTWCDWLSVLERP